MRAKYRYTTNQTDGTVRVYSIIDDSHGSIYMCTVDTEGRADTSPSIIQKNQAIARTICAALEAYEVRPVAETEPFEPSNLNGVRWADRPELTRDDAKEGTYVTAENGKVGIVLRNTRIPLALDDEPVAAPLEKLRHSSQEEIDAYKADGGRTAEDELGEFSVA